MVLVAAGIGITPYLSILHRIAHETEQVGFEKAKDKLSTFIAESSQQGTSSSDSRALHSMADMSGIFTEFVSGASDPSHPQGNESPFARHSAMVDRNDSEDSDLDLAEVDKSTEARIVSHGKHRKYWSRSMHKCFRKQYATVIWVVRDLTLAEEFVSYVTSLAAFCTHHHVDVPFVVKLFFTSGGSHDLSKMMTNVLAAIEFNTLAAAAGGDALEIHFGRPNFEAELLAAGGADTYYCGPPRFGATVAAACSKHGASLLAESFQNSTFGNIWPNAFFGWGKRKGRRKEKGRARRQNGKADPAPPRSNAAAKCHRSVIAAALPHHFLPRLKARTDATLNIPEKKEPVSVPLQSGDENSYASFWGTGRPPPSTSSSGLGMSTTAAPVALSLAVEKPRSVRRLQLAAGATTEQDHSERTEV